MEYDWHPVHPHNEQSEPPKSKFNETCGCGKPSTYQTRDGRGACNKHMRCPSYEGLVQANKDLSHDFLKLLSASKNITLFREGTEQYNEAFCVIEEYLKGNV